MRAMQLLFMPISEVSFVLTQCYAYDNLERIKKMYFC